jgi:hypothetical protein
MRDSLDDDAIMDRAERDDITWSEAKERIESEWAEWIDWSTDDDIERW